VGIRSGLISLRRRYALISMMLNKEIYAAGTFLGWL
jgi:hypothetical protein